MVMVEYEVGDYVYMRGYGPTKIKSKRRSGFTGKSVYSVRGIQKARGPGEVYTEYDFSPMSKADYDAAQKRIRDRRRDTGLLSRPEW